MTYLESCVNRGVNVRLVNGPSERSGRVELCWSNRWKAVCDDGWGIEEAITVCRELGYLNQNGNHITTCFPHLFVIVHCLKGRAIAVTGSHFGDAQEIHQLKQWNCQSTETTIAYCGKAIAYRYCSGSETAGVYCQGGL